VILGALAITPGARAALPEDFVVACFRRHATGDFGELDPHDVTANLAALITGDRVLSEYRHGDVKVFVITEADRSRTTLLLASEY
jgi:hypothetical protein